MSKALILVSNDDGVSAEGIQALAAALRPLGRVVIVAPAIDQSAVSHAMSFRKPLRLTQLRADEYAVDGTPGDAVYMAVHHILKGQKIDLVVSGINHGANLGDDVFYSGTVSAAKEAVLLGIPGVAFSLVSSHHHNFSVAAEFAYQICASLLRTPPPKDTLLNVNIPKRVTQPGFMATTLGQHQYENVVEKRLDPSGQAYYWIGGPWSGYEDLPGTDCKAIAEGKISVTPIEMKLTNQRLLSWVSSLLSLLLIMSLSIACTSLHKRTRKHVRRAPKAAAEIDDGKLISLAWPVKNAVLFRTFDKNPARPFEGIALGAPALTPVMAAADGEVLFVGDYGNHFGQVVIIQHVEPFLTVYGNLDRIDVDKNKRVKQGDVIGSVGVSGGAESPRLFFQVRKNRSPVDPERYFKK